jgi:hypothetical protein
MFISTRKIIKLTKEILMSVEAKLDQIIEKLATAATPVDVSGLATSAEVNALAAKIDALAAVVGTEAAPAPAQEAAPTDTTTTA